VVVPAFGARARVDYQRQDNYVAWVEDLARAQKLLDGQAQTPWRTHLQKLLEEYHPLHREICRPLDWEDYWTCCESEFASDVLFQEPARRAAVSRAANQRYLEALAAVKETTRLGELAAALCQPVRRGGRRYRALNPFSPADSALLQALQRGEWTVSGLRNKDLRRALYPRPASAGEERRRAARVSRLLALLRAHGIVRKAGPSHRYYVSAGGRVQITALLAAQQATPEQLTRPAAVAPQKSAQE
jgi:hypothetical protein